jgi:protein-S-isoprenylcysteine O-methyltransferase Ste14
VPVRRHRLFRHCPPRGAGRRHPIRSHVGLAYGNWLGLAAFTVLPLIAAIYRIRVEEKGLRDTLGERYWSYARERKRLVPFVW